MAELDGDQLWAKARVAMLTDRRLTWSARDVFDHIALRAVPGVSWVGGQEEIAISLRLSVSTVRRATKLLETSGYLGRFRTIADRTNYHYYVLDGHGHG